MGKNSNLAVGTRVSLRRSHGRGGGLGGGIDTTHKKGLALSAVVHTYIASPYSPSCCLFSPSESRASKRYLL